MKTKKLKTFWKRDIIKEILKKQNNYVHGSYFLKKE